MPLIFYLCPDRHSTLKFFREIKDAPSEINCKECGVISKKSLKPPSTASIIKVDNGIQARATEVNLDLIEDIKVRSTKDFKQG